MFPVQIDTVREALKLPKIQLPAVRSDVFSMGKVRQEYQAVRKWYIEQNKKMSVIASDASLICRTTRRRKRISCPTRTSCRVFRRCK